MEATCKLGEKGCWNDGKCRATLNCECKVITNADRIRSMSDEELAEFLRCPREFENPAPVCFAVRCNECVAIWLKQPVKDGEDE